MAFTFGRLGKVAKQATKLNRDKMLVRLWKNKEVQTFILDLNRVSQLFEDGVGSDGKVFGLYASDQGTVNFKGKTKNKKRNSRISLFDTGEFYRSFDIKQSGSEFKITADDIKEGKSLTAFYGKEILGLSIESINELSKKVLPIIIADTRGFLSS